MREFLRRSITGIVYMFLLLSAVFLSSDAFDFLFMAFGLACLYEFKKLVKIQGYYVFIGYLALWWAFIHLIHDLAIVKILLCCTLIVDLALLGYLFSKEEIVLTTLQKYIAAILYIGGGCIFLTMIPYNTEQFDKLLIMGVFILIWVNDSFAYIVGKTMGRHKLIPRISPKKTIEGSLGGLIFALIAAYIMSRYETTITMWQWIILALVIVTMGNLGDLLESKFKRMAEVKDSGAILPGHGGILDRLDSLVYAAPFAYLTLILFAYVS